MPKKTNKPEPESAKRRQQMVGRVTSTKMQNSIVVEVMRVWRHPVYKKALQRSRKFLVHNDSLELVPGDLVKIEATRPLSGHKHYRVIGKVSQL